MALQRRRRLKDGCWKLAESSTFNSSTLPCKQSTAQGRTSSALAQAHTCHVWPMRQQGQLAAHIEARAPPPAAVMLDVLEAALRLEGDATTASEPAGADPGAGRVQWAGTGCHALSYRATEPPSWAHLNGRRLAGHKRLRAAARLVSNGRSWQCSSPSVQMQSARYLMQKPTKSARACRRSSTSWQCMRRRRESSSMAAAACPPAGQPTIFCIWRLIPAGMSTAFSRSLQTGGGSGPQSWT